MSLGWVGCGKRCANMGDDWTALAACRGLSSQMFFPEDHGPYNGTEAKRVCELCDVRQECLTWALEHHETFGIWGGLNARERARLRVGATLRFRQCMFCKDMFTFAWVDGSTRRQPNYCNDLCQRNDRLAKRREWRRGRGWTAAAG